MKNLKGLTILECPFCYNAWSAQYQEGHLTYQSSVKKLEKPRDVELYHKSGVYELANAPVDVHELEDPAKGEEACVSITRQVSGKVCEALKAGNGAVLNGGYCNYAPAVAGGIQRALGKDAKIGVIWIDAHADGNILEKRDRALRLVAVPVSTMLGETMESYRREVCGLEKPIDGERMLAGDVRFMDEEEAAMFERKGACHVDASVFENPILWEKEVRKMADHCEVIYLSVDADILKADFVPAYEKRVPGGHDVDVVMRNIRTVMKTGKVCAFSLFCVDFDHYERGGMRTYFSGMELLESALESWKQVNF